MLGSMVSRGYRLTALKGAQIIIYPTAIGWHPKEKKNLVNLNWTLDHNAKISRNSKWNFCSCY